MASDARYSRIPMRKSTISGEKRSSSIHGSSARPSSAARRSNSCGPSNRFEPSSQPPRITPKEFIKDPRPINEKKFKESATSKLVALLANNNYPHKIELFRISNTEFRRIFEFIVSLILPGYKAGRLEDEVPKMMRLFDYPFTISKTTVSTIGAPHSWPQLLACLNYLCDYVNIRLVFQPEDSNIENLIIRDYTKKCYDKYFSQNSDSLDFPELDQWLENGMLGSNDNESRLEQMKYDELSASLNAVKVQMDKDKCEIDYRNSMISDCQKMGAYNGNYVQHNNQQRLFLEREKVETHDYKQRYLELKDAVINKEHKYADQKQVGHLRSDFQQTHEKLTKCIELMSDKLAKYELETCKLVQKNYELHHEILEKFGKVSLQCQSMGISNQLVTTNFSEIQNDTQLSDYIKKLLTFLNELQTQNEDKCRQLEFAVAQEKTAYGIVEVDKFSLEQNLFAVVDEIGHLENHLAQEKQKRQDLMLLHNEERQLNYRMKEEEKNLVELRQQVYAQEQMCICYIININLCLSN